MQIKVKDILAQRSGLGTRCKNLATKERQALLGELIAAVPEPPPGTAGELSEASILAAFARVFWIKYGLHGDLKEGKQHLRIAKAIFVDLAQGNRLLAFLARDVDIFLGTLLISFGDHAAALTAFDEAIADELNKDRRALGLLNIARTHMYMGNFFQSLAAAESCTLAELQDEVMLSYFHLLKARLLLMLGYKDLARASLANLPPQGPDKARLEAMYLHIFCKASPDTMANLKDDFELISIWLDQQQDEASAQFYRLEWLVLTPLVEPQAITNRRTYLDKVRYLARQTNREDYYTLAAATTKVVWNTKCSDADYASLQEAQQALVANADHLVYQQHLLQTAGLLLGRRQFMLAAGLLLDLQQRLHKQELDLPRKLATRLATARNTTQEHIELLQSQLPQAVREKIHSLGSFLMD